VLLLSGSCLSVAHDQAGQGPGVSSAAGGGAAGMLIQPTCGISSARWSSAKNGRPGDWQDCKRRCGRQVGRPAG